MACASLEGADVTSPSTRPHDTCSLALLTIAYCMMPEYTSMLQCTIQTERNVTPSSFAVYNNAFVCVDCRVRYCVLKLVAYMAFLKVESTLREQRVWHSKRSNNDHTRLVTITNDSVYTRCPKALHSGVLCRSHFCLLYSLYVPIYTVVIIDCISLYMSSILRGQTICIYSGNIHVCQYR